MPAKKREITHFRELETYRKAFASAMTIYELTKTFPVEEK
jgi:hypothetical protein